MMSFIDIVGEIPVVLTTGISPTMSMKGIPISNILKNEDDTFIDEVKNGTYEEIVNSRDMESEDVVRNPKISFRAKPAEKKGALHNTRSGSLLPQRLHGKFLR
ncbi:hypothetical protein [Ligilactobacillus saerimneri]|uniref:hypothetical protein n=1 Tax=Ligilactobacillus saerimneri TaxID=228229 RepID=UPI0024B8ADFC|nr:hypothetical protein [Ligilactobacillus saerimneri]